MRYFMLLVLVFVSACSGSSVSEEPDDFDLARYFFHSDLDTVGGEVRFVENHYEKPSGIGPVYSPTTIHTNTGSGIEQSGVSGVVYYRYTIGEDAIVQDGVSFTSSRSHDRFAKLGETYSNVAVEELGFSEICTLQNQLSTFNLATATGSVTIATGVYEDVIQVYCDSVFTTSDGGTRPNYSWTKYYAKGVGLIFLDGTWPNLELGDIYGIPRY